jgi:prephenate dehydratase
MALQIAHLGPTGTNAEFAAIAYAKWVHQHSQLTPVLCPQASIAQTLQSVASADVNLAVVPVENSIEGAVAMTLDTLWELPQLIIQQALILPITHALLSTATQLTDIQVVRSHPQALGQCQRWLQAHLPQARLVPTPSTSEPLEKLAQDPTSAAISAPRAAELYGLPILACPINDHPDNCTRFWIVGQSEPPDPQLHADLQVLPKAFTSLAFSLPANRPGALVDSLQVFAQSRINLSRIESRPTKRSLGEYLFFIDLEGDAADPAIATALAALQSHTETLKIFGSYPVLPIITDL